MARPSLPQLNAEFAAHGFELVKGEGYFYFASLPDASREQLDRFAEVEPASVYVCHFCHIPVSRWRARMAEVAENMSRVDLREMAERRAYLNLKYSRRA